MSARVRSEKSRIFLWIPFFYIKTNRILAEPDCCQRNSWNKTFDILRGSGSTGQVDFFKIEGIQSVVGIHMRLQYRKASQEWKAADSRRRSRAGDACPLMISPLEWRR